jgi:hypothetical protein
VTRPTTVTLQLGPASEVTGSNFHNRYADNGPGGTAQRRVGMVRNFLLRLLAAAHESRQRHAALVIERHAHLLGEAADHKARRAENIWPATEILAQWTLVTACAASPVDYPG